MGLILGKVGGLMSGLSTALRAVFIKRDPATALTRALLIVLVVAVVVAGALIVADQLRGL